MLTGLRLAQGVSFGDNTILQVVFFVIVWLFIPLVIASMLVLAIALAVRAPRGDRVAAVAGIFAGLILFSAYVATQITGVDDGSAPSFAVRGLAFTWAPVLTGVVVGFGAPWVIRVLRGYTNLLGILTLLLSSAGMLALFNYFFASQFRDFTVLLSLSVLFGILLHVAIVPGFMTRERSMGYDSRRT